MKRRGLVFISLLVVMLVGLMIAGFAMSAEIYKPGRTTGSSIGTANYPWANGYFNTLNNAKMTVASKDWGDASGTWTLSTTEANAAIIYNQNSSVASWVIVAPAEQKMYVIYNNGSASGTIKKSGGTGVVIPGYAIYQVAYFPIGASNDYHSIATGDVVPAADRL